MRKTLLFLSFFASLLFWLIITPKVIFAENTITFDKAPVIKEDFTVTVRGDVAFAAGSYGYLITPKIPDPNNNCFKGGSLDVPAGQTNFSFKIRLDECNFSRVDLIRPIQIPNRPLPKPGEWELQVYVRKTFLNIIDKSQIDPADFIIKDWPFVIQQEGGQNVSIEAIVKEVEISKDAPVRLINQRAGTTYTFWWDGAKQISKVHTASADGNVDLTIGPAAGAAIDSPGKRKLCMEIGDYHLTPPVCSNQPGKFVFFEYKAQVASQPGCTFSPAVAEPDDSLTFSAIDLRDASNQMLTGNFKLVIKDDKGNEIGSHDIVISAGKTANPFSLPKLGLGRYTGNLRDGSKSFCPTDAPLAVVTADQKRQAQQQQVKLCDPKDPNCTSGSSIPCNPQTGATPPPNAAAFNPVDFPGVLTAIGCVPTEPQALVSGVFRFVAAFAGAATLLIMFFGALQMITAAGNPEQVKKGMDQFTASIWGLVFLLIAVLLLKFIGVDILNIPGFS